MTFTKELTFTIALMGIVGIALFLFILKHLKKIAVVAVALLILLSVRAVRLGYAAYYYNQAKNMATDITSGISNEINELPGDIEQKIDEHVDLPDASDTRFMYYYDKGSSGFGIPDNTDAIEDKAEEMFGE